MTEAVVVDRAKLERWKKLLEAEPSIPGDGISTIKEELSEMIFDFEKQKTAPKTVQSIHDVTIGDVYLLPDNMNTRDYLRGIPVKVVEKKRTNVIVTLERNAGKYKAGQRFDVAATALTIPKEDNNNGL